MGKRFKVGVPTSKNLQMKKATREGKCTTDTPFIIYGSTATRIKLTAIATATAREGTTGRFELYDDANCYASSPN